MGVGDLNIRPHWATVTVPYQSRTYRTRSTPNEDPYQNEPPDPVQIARQQHKQGTADK